MEKLRKFLSLAVVLAITLFGSLALTACGGTDTPANLGDLPELPSKYETYADYINDLNNDKVFAPANLGELPELPDGYDTYEDYINHILGNQAVPDTFTIVGEWGYEDRETDENSSCLTKPGYELKNSGFWVGTSISQYFDEDSGKYIIEDIDGIEGTYELKDFTFVNSETISATYTTEVKEYYTFNADGTFVNYYYWHSIYSDYDEIYEGRLYWGGEHTDEYYYSGTYSVDGGKLTLIFTEEGEMDEDGEIEWDGYTGAEQTMYITLDKQIYQASTKDGELVETFYIKK
jgi:hypothetical protein